MKKSLLLILIILPFVFLSCGDDEDDEFVFSINCIATYGSRNMSCYFYFFEPGDYVSFERNDFDSSLSNYGTATAIKKDGTRVKNVGYAYYFDSEKTYAEAKYLNPHVPITEGSFYVVCTPPFDAMGGGYPYKAKEITKEKIGVLINPNFTQESIRSERGEYKYYEWDE